MSYLFAPSISSYTPSLGTDMPMAPMRALPSYSSLTGGSGAASMSAAGGMSGANWMAFGFRVFSNVLRSKAIKAEGERAYSNSLKNARSVIDVAEFNSDMVREEASYNAGLIKLQAAYDAAVENNNSIIASRNAVMARQNAAYKADRIKDYGRRHMGMQVSRYAKAGIDLEGTAQDVIYDSAMQNELDILAAKYVGEVEARNFEYEKDMHVWRGNTILTMAGHEAAKEIWGGAQQAKAFMVDARARADMIKREGEAMLRRSRTESKLQILNIFG